MSSAGSNASIILDANQCNCYSREFFILQHLTARLHFTAPNQIYIWQKWGAHIKTSRVVMTTVHKKWNYFYGAGQDWARGKVMALSWDGTERRTKAIVNFSYERAKTLFGQMRLLRRLVLLCAFSLIRRCVQSSQVWYFISKMELTSDLGNVI